MESKNTSTVHFHSIDFLRAIGAISVCLFHLATNFLEKENPVYFTFQHGHLGVELFFVITGFLIPFSLFKRNHSLRNWGTFMLDRVIRIHPAYIGAVVICVFQELLTSFLPAPMYKPFSVTLLDIFGHFTYLQPYLGRPWLVVLFWTLAVQFQFYMLYGVLHFLFIHEHKIVRILTILVLYALPFGIGKGTIDYGLGAVELNNFLPHYIHIFLPGVFIFMRLQKLLSNLEYIVLLLLDCYLLYYWYGGMEHWYDGDILRPIAVVFASVLIQFVAIEHKIFEFLGKISYSLYLVHISVGWAIMGFLKFFLHLENQFLLSIAVLFATATSIGFAYLYWRFWEEPAVAKVKSWF
jgi:peptidoglycan/LPS O-acetylase OafA/YrhL